MKPLRTSAAVLLVLIVAAPALAQVPDLSGTWGLDSSILIVGEDTPCVYSGGVTLTQMGSTLSGNAVQVLESGPAACLPLMMAAVSGEVDMMGCVTLGALSGPLGSVAFAGCPGNMEGSLVGEMEVESGPFAGATGTWSAVLGGSTIAIPTLTDVGLVALVVLILVAGAWVMRRRGAVT